MRMIYLIVVVLSVFNKEGYAVWSFQMKEELIKQNLWDVVEADTKPPKLEYDEIAFKAWSKNCKALYLIRESFGPLAFPLIGKISKAKIAWNTLARKYNPKSKLSLSSIWKIQVLKHSKIILKFAT